MKMSCRVSKDAILGGYSESHRAMNSIVEEQQRQKMDLLTLFKS